MELNQGGTLDKSLTLSQDASSSQFFAAKLIDNFCQSHGAGTPEVTYAYITTILTILIQVYKYISSARLTVGHPAESIV